MINIKFYLFVKFMDDGLVIGWDGEFRMISV